MNGPAYAEKLARHDETRLRFLRSRLGDAGLAASIEMRDIEFDIIRNLSEEEAESFFETVPEKVTIDPLTEADAAFTTRIRDLWVPTYGYTFLHADVATGIHLERQLGRALPLHGPLRNFERLTGLPAVDDRLEVSKLFHGINDRGEPFKKRRQVHASDHAALMRSFEKLSEIDELIDIELDV